MVKLTVKPAYIKRKNQVVSCDNYLIFSGAEDGAQTRDPQLGRLMLYQLSYFRNLSGQRWIRTTEGVSQQIYSLPHLATLVFAHSLLIHFPFSLVEQVCFSIAMQRYGFFLNLQMFCEFFSLKARFFLFTSSTDA